MKKQIIAICCLALVWGGCKENNTPIDFSTHSVGDTSYVLATVPTADLHEALVEEFTGQTCPNCPAAHVLLEDLSKQPANVGRMNTIGLYINGLGQTKPPTGALYDFRNDAATRVNAAVFSIPGLPTGGVDRLGGAGARALFSSSWAGVITSQLATVDSVNLSVVSVYDTASKKATITAVVTYLYPSTTIHNLSIVVVEDSIHDLQEMATGSDDPYVFTNVFRDMVTGVPLGDALDAGHTVTAKVAGHVFQKVYDYSLKATIPAIVPKHCRVIAFVSNTGTGGDYRVLQSKQCKFAP